MLIFEIFFAFFFTVAFPDTTYYKDFSRLLDMSAKVGGGERGGGQGGGVVLRQASLPPRQVSPITSRNSSPLACAARRRRSPKQEPRAEGARRGNSISNAAAAWRAGRGECGDDAGRPLRPRAGSEDSSRGAVSCVRRQSRDASPRAARRSVPLPPDT